MKRGTKATDPNLKIIAGTFRPSRDGDRSSVEPLVATAAPAMPTYLPADARRIWREEIGRVVASGAGDPDASLFGRYCIMEAAVRRGVREGGVPQASFLAELRKSAELLGIAGPSSRIGRGTKTKDAGPTGFAALKRP